MTVTALLFCLALAASVVVGTAAGYLVGVRLDRWLISRAMNRGK